MLGIAPIQIVAVAGSLGLLLIIVDLVRKRRLAEEYALLWILVGIAFVAISLFRSLIEEIGALLGIVYAPSAIFLIAIFFIIWLLLHFSLIVSDLAKKTRSLTQEIALLRVERAGRDAAPGPRDAARTEGG